MQQNETDLSILLKNINPILNSGDYVICTTPDFRVVNIGEIVMMFRENEGFTIILKKELADTLGLSYSFTAAWITLVVNSSLLAIGFTSAFAKALTENGISCNVVAAFYHDHIFVAKKDTTKAMKVLKNLSYNSNL